MSVAKQLKKQRVIDTVYRKSACFLEGVSFLSLKGHLYVRLNYIGVRYCYEYISVIDIHVTIFNIFINFIL